MGLTGTGRKFNIKTDRATVLHHFRRGIYRFFVLIVALACFGGVIGWVVSTVTYKPVYTVSVVTSVESDIAYSTNYYNYSTATIISTAFPQIVQSDTMISLLKNAAGDKEMGKLSVSATESALLFVVSVSASDPDVAYDTMITFMDYYPDVMALVFGSTELVVLSDPQYPGAPDNEYSPIGGVLSGFFIGIALALAIIFTLAFFEDTVMTEEDVRKKLGQKTIGTLPNVVQGRDVPVTVLENIRQNGFSDAVHSMANGFLSSTRALGAKTVLVTSTLPGEGKTTVSANLALVLASRGKRVLLCDADIRSPSIWKTLDMEEMITPEYPAISGVLLCEQNELRKKLEDATLSFGDFPLDVILSVPDNSDGSKDNSSEILESERMGLVMEMMKQKYDFIIFDTAPVGFVSDAVSLARYCDGFLFVVRQDTVPTDNILSGIDGFSFSGAKSVGVVMNNVKFVKSGYGYSDYGKYGYGKYSYGYGYGYGNGMDGENKDDKENKEEPKARHER